MRICPVCKLGLRVNDPSGGLTVAQEVAAELNIQPGVYGGVCSDCCSRLDPSGPWVGYVAMLENPFPLVEGNGVPHTYPGGLSPSPAGLEQAPAWFCGVCRRFARDGDHMESMRLYPEDAPDALHLFPNAVCSLYDGGHCIVCNWMGPYEARCPQCWQRERLAGLEHHKPGENTRRDCEWAGPWQELCPQCDAPTRRREECYYCCGECRVKYWPAIVRRLKRQGIVADSFSENIPPVPHMLC